MLRFAGPSGQSVRTAAFLMPDVMPFVGVLLALVVTVLGTIPSNVPSAKLDLPPAVMCSCSPMTQLPRFRVLATGITVDGKPSSLSSLLADIRATESQNGEKLPHRVVLSATAETPYGKVAEAVDRLSSAGFKISLNNEDLA